MVASLFGSDSSVVFYCDLCSMIHMDSSLTIKRGAIIQYLGFGWGGNASRQNASGQTVLQETWASRSIVIFYLLLSTCGSEDLNCAEAPAFKLLE